MDTVLEQVNKVFREGAVPLDEAGYLCQLGPLFGEHRPLILFLADAGGRVQAAHDLGSGMDLEVARRVAAAAHSRLRHKDSEDLCLFESDFSGQACCAFGLYLSPLPDGEMLGGLLAAAGNLHGELREIASALRSVRPAGLDGNVRTTEDADAADAGPALAQRTGNLAQLPGRRDCAGRRRTRDPAPGRTRPAQRRAVVRGQRSRQPRQEPVPGQHEPRDPHAAHGNPRIHGTPPQRRFRGKPEGAGRLPGDDSRQRQSPPGTHQRHPGSLQDRSRPNRCRARSPRRRRPLSPRSCRPCGSGLATRVSA